MNVPVMESCNGWTIVTPETTKTFTVSGVSFNMIRVKKGTFTMGATSEQTGAFSDEKPAHTVTLTSSYYMGETEVTQELYQAVVGSNPSTYSGTQKPVTDVSWNDCQTFITKLNNLTGLTFRLPTEAEWEYAARGGSKSKGYQYSGSNTIGDVAYYLDNNEFFCSGATNVKSKSPNELGLYDMSGNVSEWCQDWYGSYSSSAQTNPTGPTSGSSRVIRGGAFVSYAWGCRVANRGSFTPSYACNNNGFRLVLSGFH
ncbi:MAG: formylglycine-generating enzyme family protein [Bacteroidaceae bacterium]|nr:formylglycine-generating enzyme family protein [Bacteroidaceae bacterium]